MNKIDLAGRAGVVTGGARGIGYAIAERFLESGAKVALFDRDKAALDEAAAALKKKGTIATQVADVTDEASMQRAFDATAKAFGKVDIMVNNAGIAGKNFKVWECPADEFRAVVEVDLIGVFLGCKVAAAHMIKNKYGRIVNVASIAGKEGNPNASHYSAAKAGVIALSKSMQRELASSDIVVMVVAPGATDTPLFRRNHPDEQERQAADRPFGRPARPEEVANVVAYAASDESSCLLAGQTLHTNGGVFMGF